MMSLKVEQSVWIAASRERVWRAITDPEQLSQWWSPHRWEIPSLEVGAGVKFGDDEGYSFATIENLDPPNVFGLRWDPETAWPDVERHDIPLRTIYVLTEEDGGTRVKVTETGFESLPDDVRRRRFDMTVQGYVQVLDDLQALVESEAGQK